MLSILGYSDTMSAAPGEAIRFMVSCEDGASSFEARIVRLLCTDDHPEGPGRREREVESPVTGPWPGRRQPIHMGSCVVVPDCAALDALESFTLQVLVWPTTPTCGRQGLATRWCNTAGQGFGLVIDGGCAALMLGRGGGEPALVSSGKPLLAREWHRVTASYDARRGIARVVQTPLSSRATAASTDDVARQVGRSLHAAPDAPLLFAAWQETPSGPRRVTGGHYNGKLEAPRLAAEALSEGEIASLAPEALVGAWDFSRDIAGEVVTDLSPARLHGRTVNLPARAVTGHDWTGESLSWRESPDQYGAIHFHDDDLADAGWEADFSLEVPEDMPSGVYAARLESGSGLDYVPFVVRPRAGRAAAPLAFVLPTATCTAYANTRLAVSDPLDEIVRGSLYELFEADLHLQEHPELGRSLYDAHFDGSPVVYSSRLRPVLNIRPGTRLWNFNADMMVVEWLDAKGIAHDVVTDEDLDRDGLALLAPYRAVLTGSHPEYLSPAMMAAFEGYLAGGGRLMYLGGNGFYWQIAFHRHERGIVECRKSEGVRNFELEPGERHHSFDGRAGGLWRSRGRAPNRLVGVGTSAFGFDSCGHYRRTAASFDPRAAFIFEGIGADEAIGDFGLVGGGAAGIEVDRYERALGSPAHALVVARSAGLSRCYLPAPEEVPCLHPAMSGDENPEVRADMVFFEGPRGGAVFSTGSIAWATSLCPRNADNNVSRITENVLRRFLDAEPFA